MKKFLHNKENIILLYLTIITGIYPVFITHDRLMKILNISSFIAVISHYLLVFFFFFVLPAIIIKFVFKEKLKEYGFNFKNFNKGIKFIIIVLPILVALIWFSSFQKEFQTEYPLSKEVIGVLHKFVIIEIVYLFYYIGWEFLFRGFVLFGLEKKLGLWLAIMIQTIPSTLLHYTKPSGEIILSLIAGFVLGYYVLKYRSVSFAIIIHWIAGIMMDSFVILHL